MSNVKKNYFSSPQMESQDFDTISAKKKTICIIETPIKTKHIPFCSLFFAQIVTKLCEMNDPNSIF